MKAKKAVSTYLKLASSISLSEPFLVCSVLNRGRYCLYQHLIVIIRIICGSFVALS